MLRCSTGDIDTCTPPPFSTLNLGVSYSGCCCIELVKRVDISSLGVLIGEEGRDFLLWFFDGVLGTRLCGSEEADAVGRRGGRMLSAARNERMRFKKNEAFF